MKMERNWSCSQSREICVIHTKNTWVKKWRRVLWTSMVCSLTCHFVTGLGLVTTLYSFGIECSEMWSTYGLWISKIKASSYVFFSPSSRTIILYLKVQCKFCKVISSEFCHLERLIKGGNGRESEPLQSLTVCCLPLPKLIMDMELWKRPAEIIRILLEHFRIILKWDLYWYLRWKLMLILLAAVMWGNVQCWGTLSSQPEQVI